MSNLTTRKIVLGLLMALVLAFSVQGIANALTLEKTSGDFQTKPAGSTFEITFSVRLDSNSTRIYNSNGQQTDEYGNEIDGSGYLIEYVRGNARRLISVSGTGNLSDANSVDVASDVTSYAVPSLPGVAIDRLKVRLSTERSNISSFGDELMEGPSGNLYLSGTSVVDDQDRAVYVEN